MILMPPHSLSPKQPRKPQALVHIFLSNNLIPILRLSDDEFGNLRFQISIHIPKKIYDKVEREMGGE
jgi:hypothetical protein